MRFVVNGKEQEIRGVNNLKALLDLLGYEKSFVAVALNWQCIPRQEYESTALNENDSIEILSPAQGG